MPENVLGFSEKISDSQPRGIHSSRDHAGDFFYSHSSLPCHERSQTADIIQVYLWVISEPALHRVKVLPGQQ